MINREYSWLKFNDRVLDQALDPTNPLLEQCKFLSIGISNMDEFCQVRLGSLLNQNEEAPDLKENKADMTAAEQIKAVLSLLPSFYQKTESIYRTLTGALYSKGINILGAKSVTDKQKKELKSFFDASVLPRLSPLVLDAKHPLIKFENLRTYLALRLERNGRAMFGVLPIGQKLDRLVRIPGGKKVHLIPIEDIIYLFGHEVFPGYTIKEKALVRITRNADFTANMEDADIEYDYDFSKLIRTKVESRTNLDALRLEMNTTSDWIRSFIAKQTNLKKSQCFTVKGCFDYKFMFRLESYFDYQTLPTVRYSAFKGATPRELWANPSLIDYLLNKNDIFLSYPYQSIDTLIKLLDECAIDSRVTNIKITIYRLASHSLIAEALAKAAENGKDVTIVMELCARFDEENNLYYAKQLQEAGCTVFYGIEDYKVHSKIISIVLEEEDKVSYITHLGTGNYNENTSRQYTDLNYITSDETIGLDAVSFFQNLATLNVDATYKKLLIAPYTLKKGLLDCIDEEKAKGSEGRIIFKMNSLTDLEIIDKLLEASRQGVEVQMIVRGICCLLPGVKGESEHITVRSIVGRFLEHSRIYLFGKDGDERIYISSADLMTRNTVKRVEIATPIENEEFKKRISHILALMLADNVKARILSENGDYHAAEQAEGEKPINAQEIFLKEALS